MLAMCIIHYIDGLAWGVVLSCVMGLSRTSKTDNPNSPTLEPKYNQYLIDYQII